MIQKKKSKEENKKSLKEWTYA